MNITAHQRGFYDQLILKKEEFNMAKNHSYLQHRKRIKELEIPLGLAAFQASMEGLPFRQIGEAMSTRDNGTVKRLIELGRQYASSHIAKTPDGEIVVF